MSWSVSIGSLIFGTKPNPGTKETQMGSFKVTEGDLSASVASWATRKGVLTFGNSNQTGLRRIVEFRSAADMTHSNAKKDLNPVEGTTNKTTGVAVKGLRKRVVDPNREINS